MGPLPSQKNCFGMEVTFFENIFFCICHTFLIQSALNRTGQSASFDILDWYSNLSIWLPKFTWSWNFFWKWHAWQVQLTCQTCHFQKKFQLQLNVGNQIFNLLHQSNMSKEASWPILFSALWIRNVRQIQKNIFSKKVTPPKTAVLGGVRVPCEMWRRHVLIRVWNLEHNGSFCNQSSSLNHSLKLP